MAGVTVILPTVSLPIGISANQVKTAKRFTMQVPSMKVPYQFPWAPTDLVYDQASAIWDTVTRPGRPPLLIRTGTQLPTLTFTLKLAYLNNEQHAVEYTHALQILAASDEPIAIGYGQLEAGAWRMTTLTLNVSQRTLNNEVSVVDADIVMTRVSDAASFTGPVKGGVKVPATVKKASTPTTKAKPARYYIVQRGDTLWAIAVKYYGNGSKYTVIGNANGIRNMNLIQPGQKLLIP